MGLAPNWLAPITGPSEIMAHVQGLIQPKDPQLSTQLRLEAIVIKPNSFQIFSRDTRKYSNPFRPNQI